MLPLTTPYYPPLQEAKRQEEARKEAERQEKYQLALEREEARKQVGGQGPGAGGRGRGQGQGGACAPVDAPLACLV